MRPAPLPWPAAASIVTVGLTAFTACLVVIGATVESGVFSDMVGYHGRALTLLNADPLPDSFRGPGYPTFLACIYWLCGISYVAARVGNAVLLATTAAFTTLLARRVVDSRGGCLAAGAIVALYPASVLSSVYLMPESLYGLLTVLALYSASDTSWMRAGAAGVFAGLAALTRALGIGLIPVIGLSCCTTLVSNRSWRPLIARVAVLMAAAAMTLMPWLAHTKRVSGGLMLDSASAYNVLLGANPRARERLNIPDGGWVWSTYLTGVVNEADRNRRALGRAGTGSGRTPSTG